MKRMNYYERIERLKQDRETLLQVTNNNILHQLETLKQGSLTLNKKEKKDLAIVQAKLKIAQLTEEIATCKNEEELTKIRRKINYYITKIRKEIKERQIDNKELHTLYENATHIRTDISSYIRYYRRKKKLKEIIELNEKFDTLTLKEKEKLKRLLANERNYNRRNLVTLGVVSKKQKPTRKKEEPKLTMPEKGIEPPKKPEPEKKIEPIKKIKKRKNPFVAITSLLLAGSISLGALVSYLSKNKKEIVPEELKEVATFLNTNDPVLDTDEPMYTVSVKAVHYSLPNAFYENGDTLNLMETEKQEDSFEKLSEKEETVKDENTNVENTANLENYDKLDTTQNLDYVKSNEQNIADNLGNEEKSNQEESKEIFEVEELEIENTLREEEKVNYLLEYFNLNHLQELTQFLNPFIKTMEGYGFYYTEEEMTSIFYEVASTPLEEKVETILKYYGITMEQLDEVVTVYVSEAAGGGQKCEDVIAATTVGMNRTQFANWIYSTEARCGTGTGGNIYYATANPAQFTVYQNPNSYYYKFLGNHDTIAFNSVIDTIILNLNYQIYMHNYTEFRMASSKAGEQFLPNGNHYIHEKDASERINPDTVYKLVRTKY